MHLTSSPIDWYAARAAGVVAYVLLTSVVSLGLAMSGKHRLERWPRFALEEVHRFGGILVGTFIAIHVVTILVDSYLRFSIAAVLVPYASSYRPLPVALGIVAAELLLALAVTNRLRDRLGHRRWRLAHYVNFVVWTAATIHGLTVGTDRSAWWLAALQTSAVALVCALVAARFHLARREVAGAGVSGAVAALLLALVAFPFNPRPWNAKAFHDRLAGLVARQSGPTRELLSVTATGEGEQRVLLRADLLVEPQGLLATSFQLEFLPSGLRCAGHVTRVDARGFEARCVAGDGSLRIARAEWEPEPSSEFTAGTLDVHA